MRILVVDDHAATRRLLERNLEVASHGVKLAASCAQATSALAMGVFDVIVLDVMLPDGSCIELCSRLRAAKCPGDDASPSADPASSGRTARASLLSARPAPDRPDRRR